MGIWVVILEAVAAEGDRGLGIEPGACEDLAEELAGHYAVVTERPRAYETELWVEEGTAGGAVLAAQFLQQTAVRYLGLPPWEVVRAEARDAHSLEVGLIDWPDPPAAADDDVVEELPPVRPAKAATKKAPGKKAATATKAPAKKAAAKQAPAKKAVAKKAPAKKTAKRARSLGS